MKRFKAYVNYLMNFYANYFRIYRYMYWTFLPSQECPIRKPSFNGFPYYTLIQLHLYMNRILENIDKIEQNYENTLTTFFDL